MQEILRDGERLDAVNEKITLIQKKDGLTFGTDAFLLASFIKPLSKGVAVELGAGTGIISLLLAARDRFSKITAIEIQEDFAELAKRNISLNNMDGKVEILHTDATKAAANTLGGEVDVVFTNPPYKYIARHEVCGDINDFCASAFRLLKHGGKFYAVWRPDRLTDLISAMRQNRLEPKVVTFVHAHADSEPSMMLVSAIKGGASGMKVTQPLILYKDGCTEMSEKAKQIYDTMSFE